MANYFNGYNQSQYQYPQQSNSVIVVTVQGEQGASMYPVAAGNTVLLIDFNAKKFWLKATDINGLPSKFAAFTFNEVVQPTQNENNFVSRNEFDEWKKSTDAQLQQILSILVGGKDNVSTATKQPATVQAAV